MMPMGTIVGLAHMLVPRTIVLTWLSVPVRLVIRWARVMLVRLLIIIRVL